MLVLAGQSIYVLSNLQEEGRRRKTRYIYVNARANLSLLMLRVVYWRCCVFDYLKTCMANGCMSFTLKKITECDRNIGDFIQRIFYFICELFLLVMLSRELVDACEELDLSTENLTVEIILCTSGKESSSLRTLSSIL